MFVVAPVTTNHAPRLGIHVTPEAKMARSKMAGYPPFPLPNPIILNPHFSNLQRASHMRFRRLENCKMQIMFRSGTSKPADGSLDECLAHHRIGPPARHLAEHQAICTAERGSDTTALPPSRAPPAPRGRGKELERSIQISPICSHPSSPASASQSRSYFVFLFCAASPGTQMQSADSKTANAYTFAFEIQLYFWRHKASFWLAKLVSVTSNSTKARSPPEARNRGRDSVQVACRGAARRKKTYNKLRSRVEPVPWPVFGVR
uniref:SFRICE_018588 n=1 Tax=Spodoptera frugiperda TaxID=7108 RepID=A0A2H1V2R4_SPOFR